MSALQKYGWEATHITVILVVIATLSIAVHLAATPRNQTNLPATATNSDLAWHSTPAGTASRPALLGYASGEHKATLTEKSDPRQITVGPSSIQNRYTLLSVDRKPLSPQLDELTVKLHVESLAIQDLVSPFESAMLEIHSDGSEPIKPSIPFRHPVPGGNSRNQDIAFKIPTSLDLKRATLKIQYYNYQNEIPLSLPSVLAR